MQPVRYAAPTQWINYDVGRIVGLLVDAKAAVLSLGNIPYQKAWAERLQEVQLKYEVAGTSRIEGAEFTDSELDAALDVNVDEEGLTRSQRQARAAVNTYRWIADLPRDRPIDGGLVLDIHRRIVTGCDDDHCRPGSLRLEGENVLFGHPRHRGADGGDQTFRSFSALIDALNGEFQSHDILIRALAFHYHIGAMHPFMDGNGRTARAVEALLLQRSGLKQSLFIALSNYYYDEKHSYLRCLASVRSNDGDLTEFLEFGLKGIAAQCRRLLTEINKNISKALFRDMATYLFGRLESSRRRVIAERQITILNYLLDRGDSDVYLLFRQLGHTYKMKEPWSAFVRDINALAALKAIRLRFMGEKTEQQILVDVRLEWPTEITETSFFAQTKELPKAKTLGFFHSGYDAPGEVQLF
jgi:Fic family protein